MLRKDSKIYIAGHKGMVGSACWRALENSGYKNLIGKTSKELDLRNQKEVKDFIEYHKPYAIIDSAAKVGGIMANDSYPYEFLMDNLLIQNNLLKTAHEYNIPKFIFLGSSCIYPKLANQPLKEEYLLTGALEPTNEWYATAKIAGVQLVKALRKQYNRDYISLMPTNLYGPGDNYDINSSHVIPGMIAKMHNAKLNRLKSVKLWGTGEVFREFLHVDDLANSVIHILKLTSLKNDLINIGSGEELKIKDLALLIAQIIGFEGNLIWDDSKPNGTPRKLLDSTIINSLGWRSTIEIESGLKRTYKEFLKYNNER